MADPTIYYVRHGQTDWNAELRFQGQMDIPLNETGQKQADENGRKMAGILGKAEGLPFISSPLSRARETMERIRTQMGLPVEDYSIEKRLIEVSYGDLEGTSQAELKASDRERYYYRKQNPWTYRPEGGESHEDVLGRMSDWYNSLSEDCVVTAHGAIGRVLRIYLLNLDPYTDVKFAFPQDEICIIKRGVEKWL